MSGVAISIEGLRKRFGEEEAVAGIDLEIAAGSFAGLVGPNGAGRPTSRRSRAAGGLARSPRAGGCISAVIRARRFSGG